LAAPRAALKSAEIYDGEKRLQSETGHGGIGVRRRGAD
jgi:hypothetical protein